MEPSLTKSSSHGWVVVDLQSGFRSPELDELAHRVAAAIQGDPGPLWATAQANTPGGPLSLLRGWNGCATPAEQALLPQIAELAPNVVVKLGYSAALSLPVAELKALTEVRVVGADTDACVLATALGLFDLEVPVVVMADLTHSAGGSRYHEAGLALLRRQLGPSRVR